VSTAIPLLAVIALAAAIALCGVGVWAAIEMARAARSTRQLTDDLDQRLVPLSEKLDVTVDAFNAELLRVDLIVDQLEGAVDRFTGTADTVREVVDAPIHLVNEVAERFRHGFRRRGSHARRAHPQPPSDEPQAEVVLLDAAAEGDEEQTSVPQAELLGQGEDGPSVIEIAPEVFSKGEPESEIEPEPADVQAVTELEPDAVEPEPVSDLEPHESEPSDSAPSSTDEPEEA
jgi:hypothetical protein